ncbi:MAG: sigma-54-dependent Fis family transcriptional regulator [Proteobacteria bacterium]|nr:sigma-54-dependent Fis family transcriptional regulator [Pseudomonadota bacterium]
MTAQATILVVDDDPDVLMAARLLLQKHYSRVLTAEDPAHIKSMMAAGQIDVFLLDMNFAIGRNTGAEGLQWLQYILGEDPDAVVVLMTAFGDLNTAIQAMREGAADFVLKPWQNDKLIATLRVASQLRQTRARLTALSQPSPQSDMVAGSAAMQEMLKIVARVAPTDATVLIRGESGTGKELIAQALHRQSKRFDKMLVAVDLGAVAENLFESELFGHRQGAFTDARQDRAGRFQAASGGTLFLDEIGNLPLALQAKLMRVLEAREVTPLGSDQPVAVDVRLIAATNQPLEKLVATGQFREDLLYRINTIEVVLPPLRDRLDDLPALVERFAAASARKYRLPEKTFSRDALAALKAHHWPGNIRELSHTVERAVLLSDDDYLTAVDFVFTKSATEAQGRSLNLEQNERYLLETALQNADGNISHAASALGITRAALYRRIEKFGL